MTGRDSSNTNFGLLIAYILPGYTAMKGLPVPLAKITWSAGNDSTLSGFLSGTVEAMAVGLTVSTLRWLLIDTLHHRTGLRPPPWDFALLEKNVAGFELLVHIHYRYYKFYANMVVALLWSFGSGAYGLGWASSAYGVLAILFLAASRDALRKYYDRAGRLLTPGANIRIEL